jgi:hypothetical protein
MGGGGDDGRREDGRERSGEAAELEDEGAARRTGALMSDGELVALAMRVEDAKGERPHHGGVLEAELVTSDGVSESGKLGSDSRPVRPTTVH